MSNCISDNRLTRQIDHLTQYLPDQAELNGKREGASYYKQVNGKSFVEAYKVVFQRVGSLSQKFDLTQEQQSQIHFIQKDLVSKVKQAFDETDSPPANFENFIQHLERAG
tara:strand:+ start:485 stop:814 length:330 start_codon:yes stop_codon:yes gene_type:complete